MLDIIGNLCQVVEFLMVVTGLSWKPVILALPAARRQAADSSDHEPPPPGCGQPGCQQSSVGNLCDARRARHSGAAPAPLNQNRFGQPDAPGSAVGH
jgi:hypothetical protein